MKNIIVGTAGHIDHGKTTLIKALTGRNTDRWKAEQERGITIDLGFTYFDMKNGNRVGIIDVPGHEKFINNMVAGVVGMDLVMLVVAADEGIMPQTREHMNILSLLGIKKIILVLNKCDLVDREWLELVEDDICKELKGTFWENAPIVRVSAMTGQGLDKLVDTIEVMTRDEVVEKDINTISRLPIDRVFTISGIGTIITGTLITGTIVKDEILELYPLGRECKVRNIQVHGKNQKQCMAGHRAALNLSNIKKSEINRGCVLAPKNSMKNTDLLDVNLTVLPDSKRTVTNFERLHFYTGTSEILCRAILLDKEEIKPNDSGFVQLRLEEEIALKRGDRFVVRFYSPLETIGGGVVLEPNPSRKKRFDEKVIENLKKKETGSLADIMELHIKEYGETMVTLAELAKLMACSVEELNEFLQILKTEQHVIEFRAKKDIYLWHSESEYLVRERIKRDLKKYHEKYPYRYGVKKAEIYTTYIKKVKLNIFDMYIDFLLQTGEFCRVGDCLCLSTFKVLKDEKYQAIRDIYVSSFKKAKFDFLRLADIDLTGYDKMIVKDILQLLVDEGIVVCIGSELYTLGNIIDVAVNKIKEHLREESVITIAQIRDMFSTSRRSAKPILEYTDRLKITKKVGAESERVSYR